MFPSSSSSKVLNTFQTSSSNYDNVSIGNFQVPTVETNSNNFGEVDNILQGANQGEMFNLPTEYSSEVTKNQTFEFNDFKPQVLQNLKFLYNFKQLIQLQPQTLKEVVMILII